jgi:glucose/arabinose dehydrogenase
LATPNLKHSPTGLRRAALAAAAALLCAGLALPGTAAASTRAARPSPTDVVLPPGFQQVLVATGFYDPTLMTWAPDGRLFFSLQKGAIRIVKNGVLLTKPFLRLTNVAQKLAEGGMLGIAFDPNFATNHYVYVYYTNANPIVHDQVSRFVAKGDVAVLSSETVIWSGDQVHDGYHLSGEIAFGSDGKLYIAQGDNDIGKNAQNLTNTWGKILRINPDGTIPTDNPFYNSTTGPAQAIWAYGLRNPYTWAFRPGDNLMMIDDVGANTWEEVDQGAAGANYGWPATEGPTTDPRFVAPVYVYQHVETPTGECAVIGGAFYDPPVDTFPDSYRDKYFFMDHCAGWIRTYDPATGTVDDFMTGAVKPTNLTFGPDGSLYYLSFPRGIASLYKIVPTDSSGAPSR